MQQIQVTEKLNIESVDSFPFLNSKIPFRLPNLIINEDFLNNHISCRFIFGDNLVHKGLGGAAKLRNHSSSIGFITKKYPNNKDESFFKIDEYMSVFNDEKNKLELFIFNNSHLYFLISKLGSGLANRYFIFENIIGPWLLSLNKFKNVSLLF